MTPFTDAPKKEGTNWLPGVSINTRSSALGNLLFLLRSGATDVVTTLLLALSLSLVPSAQAQLDDNPLAINDAMKQFLAEDVPGDTDKLRQLQTLVRVVFLENALHFTYGPETRTAPETVEQRNGNCVSYTFLLIAMARHLGFDARLREVDIAPT
jgi:transglutaminase-like putative cysteine protease